MLLPLFACAQREPPAAWESPELVDHFLAGRVWDSRTHRFVPPGEVADMLLQSRYLLLGEKHDNPDHHRLQQTVLQQLLQAGRLDRITFEMMDSGQQPLLDDIYLQGFDSMTAVRDYLRWDADGWNWEFYGPLLEISLRSGGPVRAGNISDPAVERIYAGDLDPEITAVLDETAQASLHRVIDESHCGLLPASQFPAMARVQQARDAAMASGLLNRGGDGVSVLIAGNFHARRDLGVPGYLLALDTSLPSDQVLSVSFMEVELGEDRPEYYIDQLGGEDPYDLIWFTPALGERDYCAQLQ